MLLQTRAHFRLTSSADLQVRCAAGLKACARIVILFANCLGVMTLSAFGQTLPESARMYGGSAGSIIDLDAPIARLGDLMSEADLVVHGRIANVTVRLDAGQENVITEYTVEPIQAFKQRKADAVGIPGAVSRIVVRRSGGRLTTSDGLHLSTSVNIYPESESFQAGEEVLLFLNYLPGETTYRFTSGEFGAYRIRDGKASLMTAQASRRRGDQPTDATALFNELLRLR